MAEAIEQTGKSRRSGVVIGAVVVLYHPDGTTFGRLLASVVGQVEAVYVIDNTPESAAKWPLGSGTKSDSVTYVPLGANRGLAEAQNIGIELSLRSGCSHVLLLDQDSILMPDTVQKLLVAEQELIRQGENPAVVCPQVVDKRTGRCPPGVHYTWFFAHQVFAGQSSENTVVSDWLIASGSLLRAEAVQAVGLMRNDLFVEFIDTEWGFRARSLGFRSYTAINASMEHCIGDGSIRLFGKDFHLYSQLRYRYKLRNAAYLLRLKTVGWHWKTYTAIRIPGKLILYSAVSKNRIQTFISLIKAVGNGLRGRLGPISAEEV